MTATIGGVREALSTAVRSYNAIAEASSRGKVHRSRDGVALMHNAMGDMHDALLQMYLLLVRQDAALKRQDLPYEKGEQ